MEISDIVSFKEFFKKKAFSLKKPNVSSPDRKRRCGDNIYRPIDGREQFVQLKNLFHKPKDAETDLGGRRVLISERFVYFGRNALRIPTSIRPRVPQGRSAYGAKTADCHRIAEFTDYVFRNANPRMMGPPHSWPSDDDSWR